MASIFGAEVDSLGPKGRAPLGRIASREPLYADTRSNASVQSTPKLLEHRGFIRHVARGREDFVEPMLAHHLMRSL